MELNEYQQKTLRTANPDLKKNYKVAIAYASLKLAGEAGEVADHVGKWLGQGHKLDFNAIKLECGDVLWHLAYIANLLGFSLEDIAQANVEKLQRRYPNGFEARRSLRREVEDMIG